MFLQLSLNTTVYHHALELALLKNHTYNSIYPRCDVISAFQLFHDYLSRFISEKKKICPPKKYAWWVLFFIFIRTFFEEKRRLRSTNFCIPKLWVLSIFLNLLLYYIKINLLYVGKYKKRKKEYIHSMPFCIFKIVNSKSRVRRERNRKRKREEKFQW